MIMIRKASFLSGELQRNSFNKALLLPIHTEFKGNFDFHNDLPPTRLKGRPLFYRREKRLPLKIKVIYKQRNNSLHSWQ